VPVPDIIETERLVLRRRRVDEAALFRQLWTERDPRVPAHRRVNAEGRPTVADIAAGEPGLAFELFRAAHGCGYATEAAQAVVASASEAGYPRLWAGVWDWNVASRRVLAKLGFRETGRVEPVSEHGYTLMTVREC
jgi:hypothetical protein